MMISISTHIVPVVGRIIQAFKFRFLLFGSKLRLNSTWTSNYSLSSCRSRYETVLETALCYRSSKLRSKERRDYLSPFPLLSLLASTLHVSLKIQTTNGKAEDRLLIRKNENDYQKCCYREKRNEIRSRVEGKSGVD